jgi:hypothetical protein
MYNMTNITGANNLFEIAKATNELSNGMFFSLFLVILFFGFIIVFKKRDFKKVLLADSFFMVILTALAWGMKFVGWTYIIIPVIVFGGSLIAYQFMD